MIPFDIHQMKFVGGSTAQIGTGKSSCKNILRYLSRQRLTDVPGLSWRRVRLDAHLLGQPGSRTAGRHEEGNETPQ